LGAGSGSVAGEHLVDDVHHAVAGLVVDGSDSGVVDGDPDAAGGNRDALASYMALDGNRESHGLRKHMVRRTSGRSQARQCLAGSSRWWQGGVRECGRGFVGRREDGERAGGLEGGDELAGDDGADQGGEAEADWASWTLSLLASAWARHTDTRVIDLSMMLVAGGG
jgi:hypothetical protein